MAEKFFPLDKEKNTKVEVDSDLYKEAKKTERVRSSDFYESFDEFKNSFNNLDNKEILLKYHMSKDDLKEILNNYEIIEEILITGKSKNLQKLTFFHDYKSLNILVIFHESDTLDLSGLVSIDENHARILSNFGGNYLYLDGLQTISDEALTELIKFKGRILGLKGIEYLSEYQYSILKNKKCNLIDLKI